MQKEEQTQKAFADIREYITHHEINQNSEQVMLCLKFSIDLLQITDAGKDKQSSIVDITVKNENKKVIIELKSLSQPISLIQERNDVKEKIEVKEQAADIFEYSLLLGMNYLKVTV